MTDKELYNELDKILPIVKKKFFNNPSYYKDGIEDLYNLHLEYYTDKMTVGKNTLAYKSGIKNIEDFVKGKNLFIVNDLTEKCKDLDKDTYSKVFDDCMNKHNKTFLKTETDIIEKQSDNVKQWNNYDKVDGILIKYVSAKDEKVRHNHKLLDGTTLPKTDKFWINHTPPFDYNCRCTTIAVMTDKQVKNSIEIETTEGISNLRVTGKVFSDDHTYIKLLNKK